MCRLSFIGRSALPTTEEYTLVLPVKNIKPKSCDRLIDAIDSEAVRSVDYKDLAQFAPETVKESALRHYSDQISLSQRSKSAHSTATAHAHGHAHATGNVNATAHTHAQAHAPKTATATATVHANVIATVTAHENANATATAHANPTPH
ncbi:hypothetical protein M0804_006075 [Polistes exclamans]|nr:hypothetical protein M0804_006075 [Polistes exclamans]